MQLLPGAEPFFFRGRGVAGEVGCLILHGFTGVPGDVRGLGEYLAARGHTVYGPRLTHHGTDPSDLNRSTWRDWYFAGLDAWHVLDAQCRQIVVVGLSMGGTTALILAARQPVSAVVTLAAPIYLYPDWKLRLSRYIWRAYPFSPKPTPNPPLQEAPQQFARESYEVNPVRGVSELLAYFEVAKEHLPQVTVPALLVHSRQDQTVPPSNLDTIYERIGSPVKEQLWLAQNSHVITESAEKASLFARVADFVATHTTPAPDPVPVDGWRARWRQWWSDSRVVR